MGGQSRVPAGASAHFEFQSSSGLSQYDLARWLEPPPPVRRNQILDSGLGVLLQIGHSATGRPQETLVDLSDSELILLLFDNSRETEWHTNGQVRRAESKLSVATMVPDGTSRWVCPRSSGRVVHLHYPLKLLARLLPDVPNPRLSDSFFVPERSFELLGQAFLTELEQDGDIEPMLLENYATILARRVLLNRPNISPVRGGLAPWQIRRVVEFMEASLSHGVSLSELAILLDLSPFHFARAFKQSLGVPPHAYLSHMRLERAKTLLAHTDLPVTEIAAEVGYEAPQTLARKFQRHLGISPSAYRRERGR